MNTFEKRIVDLRDFLERHGKEPTKTTEATLSSWLRHQRWKWRNGQLQDYKIAALEELQITPDKRLRQATWLEGFKEFKAYAEESGIAHVPQGPDCPNQRLAYWEHNTRKLYWKGKLSDKQIRLMEGIGFYWNVTDMFFESKIRRLKRYHKKTGSWTPPTGGRYKDLYDWVTRIRYKKRKGRLKKHYIHALNLAGFDWESPTQKVMKARKIMDDIDESNAVSNFKRSLITKSNQTL